MGKWQSSGKFTSNLTASALSVLLMAASQQCTAFCSMHLQLDIGQIAKAFADESQPVRNFVRAGGELHRLIKGHPGERDKKPNCPAQRPLWLPVP